MINTVVKSFRPSTMVQGHCSIDDVIQEYRMEVWVIKRSTWSVCVEFNLFMCLWLNPNVSQTVKHYSHIAAWKKMGVS